MQITAARNDVPFFALFGEDGCGHRGDQFGLMLTIAINRDQHVITVFQCELKCGPECGTISLILGMSHHLDTGLPGQHLGSAIGRPIIHHQDIRAVAADLLENPVNVRRLVIDRQGGQQTKSH